MNEIEQKEQLVSSPLFAYQQLATLINPHMRLRDEHVEWVRSVMDRHHDAELYVKLAQDAQVEQFARELNGDDGTTVTITASEPRRIARERKQGKIRAFFGTYYPALLVWSATVLGLAVAYILTFGV